MDREQLISQLIQDPSFERWVHHQKEADASYWEKWVRENPQYQEEVAQARKIVKGVVFHRKEIPDHQIDASWQQLSQRTVGVETNHAFWKKSWLRYAAVISLTLLAGIGGWVGYISATTTTYETPFGVTRTLVLDDGTSVILNANSELTHAKDWLKHPRREVYLRGEAYFSVTQRTNNTTLMPFVVNTEDLSIRVVGTQFNVNSRRGETQVVLDEGEVALQIPETTPETMKPGDYIVYSSRKKEVTRQQVNPKVYTSWKNRELTLDDTPLDHIIRQIEDTYGVTFTIPDESIKNRKISSTGSIVTEDLDTILEALSTLLQVRFERKSNTIYIYEN